MRKKILSFILLIGLLLIGVKSYAGLQEVEQALEGVEGWTEEKLFIDSTLITNKNKVDKLKKLKDLSLKRKGEYEKKANETISGLDKKTYVIIKNVYEYLVFKIEEVLKNPNGGGGSLARFVGSINFTPWGKQDPRSKGWGFKDFNTTKTTTLTQMTEGALKAAISGGGTIKIPAGTINFNSQIVINKSNTKIIGAGMGKTIFKYHGGNVYGIIKLVNVRNVVLQDFTLDANGKGENHTHGIWTGGGVSTNFLFRKIEVKNIGPYINMTPNQANINQERSCTADLNQKKHMKFDLSNSSGIMIGNDGNGQYFTIEGCVVRNIPQHCIGLHDSATHHGIIRNNYFEGAFMGIDLSTSSHHMDVYNNEFTKLLFGGKFQGCNNAYFHDNYIHDLYFYAYYENPASRGGKQCDAMTGFAYNSVTSANNVYIYGNRFYGYFHTMLASWGNSTATQVQKPIIKKMH